jgi:predicted HTH domain antitoxin
MTIEIPDDIAEMNGLTEREFLVEIACRLYAAQKLSRPTARRLCNLSQGEFENELIKRDIPVYQITDEAGFADIRAWEASRRK